MAVAMFKALLAVALLASAVHADELSQRSSSPSSVCAKIAKAVSSASEVFYPGMIVMIYVY